MPTRPRITVRTLNAAHFWHDEARMRFVIFRTAGGVTRKTSVRYGENTFNSAWKSAITMAHRLHDCPADKLASFKFS